MRNYFCKLIKFGRVPLVINITAKAMNFSKKQLVYLNIITN